MADYDGLSPGQVLADASVAEFIKSLGLGIAEAQKALDENSVQQIAEFIEPREGLGGKTLLDLGLSPAFYHYQHADITCSLQLSLKVQKNLGLGLNLNGSFNDTSTESSDSSSSSSSSESGSSTRTQSRTANIQITTASAGALTVGGDNFQLEGSSPEERIRNLQSALTSSGSAGVDRVLYQLEPSPLTITTDADESDVRVTSNSVAFLGAGHDRGIIRISETDATDYQLDTDPATITASTTAQADIEAQANHTADQIIASGYHSRAVGPDDFLSRPLFDTGIHVLRDEDKPSLLNLAQAMRQLGFNIEIEGYTDTQLYTRNSDAQNQELGENRAKAVRDYLLQNGAPSGQITQVFSRGVTQARADGEAENHDNQDYRKTEVRTVGRTDWWVLVRADANNLEDVTPDHIGGGTGNGFIYLYKPTPLELSGQKATIEGTDFPFRGAAVAGHAENSPEAYAKNLADDINANDVANLTGSASANVTTVAREGDSYSLKLITTSNRQISISSTEGITVTSQFSRSTSSSLTEQNTGNQAVAFGASLDVRYSRQFEMNVTGNSAISARLVSIPAPPEFLDTIKEFLNEDNN